MEVTMTKRDTLSIGLRLLGLFQLFRLLLGIPGTVLSLASYQQIVAQGYTRLSAVGYFAVSVFYILLMLVLALLILLRADRIAERLIPVDSEIPASNVAGFGKPILTVASQIIGVYMVATGIPDLAQVIARSHETMQFGDTLARSIYQTRNLETLATIVVGVLLVIGADYIAGLVYRGETATRVTDEV
jgi:uncharacterized membrane protein YhaH (DUF805 family)